jgi:hypothetical protein
MSYRAPGIAEKVGDALGVVRAELSGNLHRFADFIQDRQRETGAWRGTVGGGTTMAGGSGGGTTAAATSSTTSSGAEGSGDRFGATSTDPRGVNFP